MSSWLEMLRKESDSNQVFLQWFMERQASAGTEFPPEGKVFTPGMLYKHFLKVSRRNYTYWERDDTFPDFPVKNPRRAYIGPQAPRIYSREEVVKIAFWYWKRQVGKSTTAYVSVRDMAIMLRLDEAEVLDKMQAGIIPGNVKARKATREEFFDWVGSQVQV